MSGRDAQAKVIYRTGATANRLFNLVSNMREASTSQSGQDHSGESALPVIETRRDLKASQDARLEGLLNRHRSELEALHRQFLRETKAFNRGLAARGEN